MSHLWASLSCVLRIAPLAGFIPLVNQILAAPCILFFILFRHLAYRGAGKITNFFVFVLSIYIVQEYSSSLVLVSVMTKVVYPSSESVSVPDKIRILESVL